MKTARIVDHLRDTIEAARKKYPKHTFTLTLRCDCRETEWLDVDVFTARKSPIRSHVRTFRYMNPRKHSLGWWIRESMRNMDDSHGTMPCPQKGPISHRTATR